MSTVFPAENLANEFRTKPTHEAMTETKTKEDQSSPTYAEAIKWLDIWGRVVNERLVSGDPAAVPSFTGLPSFGGDSSPSDPSAILMTYAEVENWLKSAPAMAKPFLMYIHVLGVQETAAAVVYVFEDGTRSDPIRPQDLAPVSYVRAEPKMVTRRTYDLVKFPNTFVDQICFDWGLNKLHFLTRQYRRFLRGLTETAGLDPR